LVSFSFVWFIHFADYKQGADLLEQAVAMHVKGAASLLAQCYYGQNLPPFLLVPGDRCFSPDSRLIVCSLTYLCDGSLMVCLVCDFALTGGKGREKVRARLCFLRA
jgi:hypothetical protein